MLYGRCTTSLWTGGGGAPNGRVPNTAPDPRSPPPPPGPRPQGHTSECTAAPRRSTRGRGARARPPGPAGPPRPPARPRRGAAGTPQAPPSPHRSAAPCRRAARPSPKDWGAAWGPGPREGPGAAPQPRRPHCPRPRAPPAQARGRRGAGPQALGKSRCDRRRRSGRSSGERAPASAPSARRRCSPVTKSRARVAKCLRRASGASSETAIRRSAGRSSGATGDRICGAKGPGGGGGAEGSGGGRTRHECTDTPRLCTRDQRAPAMRHATPGDRIPRPAPTPRRFQSPTAKGDPPATVRMRRRARVRSAVPPAPAQTLPSGAPGRARTRGRSGTRPPAPGAPERTSRGAAGRGACPWARPPTSVCTRPGPRMPRRTRGGRRGRGAAARTSRSTRRAPLARGRAPRPRGRGRRGRRGRRTAVDRTPAVRCGPRRAAPRPRRSAPAALRRGMRRGGPGVEGGGGAVGRTAPTHAQSSQGDVAPALCRAWPLWGPSVRRTAAGDRLCPPKERPVRPRGPWVPQSWHT